MTVTAPEMTATLTRIRLNLHSQHVRRDLAHTDSLHKTAMLLAPEDLGDHPRQKAGLLFRLDRDTHPMPPTLLIQTHQPPDLTRLPASYGTIETRDLTPVLRALSPGRCVRYRITANASRRAWDKNQSDGSRHGKVVALHGDDALAWWQRRATAAGLTPTTTDTTPVPFTRSKHKSLGEKNAGPWHALTRFEGLATITDPGQLRHALLTGIGRGKPYGAGLLSLAPA
ncbi:type I-E CRISPR-associated protein Cas6/Cse3/CasE [Streptomyces bluensis]|uniref:Type I-E CRISPR-associated protein Cas6/Cse3/CasE n=1 Tax=Streptomyces bluensis TaxID=33897 RepID=A0ABW6UXX7_9ACTN